MHLLQKTHERTNLSGSDVALLDEVIDRVNALITVVAPDETAFTTAMGETREKRYAPPAPPADLPPSTVVTAGDIDRLVNARLEVLLNRALANAGVQAATPTPEPEPTPAPAELAPI